MFFKSCFVLSLLLASSYCQRTDVQGQLSRILEGLNTNHELVMEVLHQQCDKYGNEAAYFAVKNSKDDLLECLGLVGKGRMQEIDAAESNGTLKLALKKHCKQIPDLKNCVNKFTDKLDLCLSDEDRANVPIMHNITDSFSEFICYKDGERIESFISKGGPECFVNRHQQIFHCINTTVGSRVNTSNIITISELFEKEQCDNLGALQVCIVGEFKKCSEPTPANIVDSLFNLVRRATPCKNFQLPESAPKTSGTGKTSWTISSVIFIVGAFFLV